MIDPGLPKGFRDYLPEEEITRQNMIDTIRSVFERFGFIPLNTPAIERKEILTGGDDHFGMHIFTTGIDGDKEKLALRFDLTVPLARVVSEHQNEIQKPFKRYQIGTVWRGESPQAGRYREFTQCDADIVGSANILADSEIIALMHETLSGLDVGPFRIRVNNRKVLNALASYAGFSKERLPSVLRVVDKIEKQGWKKVQGELLKEGLLTGQTKKIQDILEIQNSDKEKMLNEARDLLGKESREGISELQECMGYLETFGVPEESWVFDFSVARGLGYYTGIVFESILINLPELGSVMSGGRYDNLVSRFSSQSVPATGVSLGIDRLFAGVRSFKGYKAKKSVSRVLILNFDPESEKTCVEALSAIRKAGIPSEIYLGNEKTMKGQLGYALKREIPFVLIIGSDERKQGIAQLKDLSKRTQNSIPLSSLGKEIRLYIG